MYLFVLLIFIFFSIFFNFLPRFISGLIELISCVYLEGAGGKIYRVLNEKEDGIFFLVFMHNGN